MIIELSYSTFNQLSPIECDACFIYICIIPNALWGMMMSSNGDIFRVTGPLCGEFTGHPVTGEFPHTKASDAELRCFLWSAPEYKRLSKQSWGWWFEKLLCSIWRQDNGCKRKRKYVDKQIHGLFILTFRFHCTVNNGLITAFVCVGLCTGQVCNSFHFPCSHMKVNVATTQHLTSTLYSIYCARIIEWFNMFEERKHMFNIQQYQSYSLCGFIKWKYVRDLS